MEKLNKIIKKIDLAKKSLEECNDFMDNSNANSISAAMDLLTMEINLLLKKTFLCNLHKLSEENYDWLSNEIIKKLNIIHDLLKNKFTYKKGQD
jgi:hypothetical protein